LLEHEGELVSRDQLKNLLWPNDTVVEFDHGINNTIKNIRRLLGDTADNPQYIQTIPRRGYRLMVPVEWVGPVILSKERSDESKDLYCGDAFWREEGPAVPAVDDSGALSKAKLKVGRLTGKVVSHYRVLEVIGGGGMGLVYRAEDLKLGRAVALKFLPEEVGDDPRARERFEREAKAVSALSHTNICPIYEFDEYEGLPFFVMELLQGKTLRDHLADGRFRLTQPQGLGIAIQIASGLEAAHEKGIIHRDIKPANIFITEKNVAKILDFGVAKVIQLSEPSDVVISSEERSYELRAPYDSDEEAIGVPRLGSLKTGASSLGMTDEIDNDVGAPKGAPLQNNSASEIDSGDAQRRAEDRHYPNQTTLTRTGMKLGTAGYMSPEQVRGEPLDARTDIFSFGLVLYEMATGERAFTGETEAVLHDAIQHREPKPVRESAPEIPPKVEEIIEKCLEKERDQRLQTGSELHAALLGAQRVSSPVVPTPLEEDKPAASHRKLWVATVLSAALLIAVVATVLYRRAHPGLNLTDKDTIVLADLENMTGDEVFDGSLTEALRTALEQTPFLNLLSSDKVNRVVKQMGGPGRDALTLELARSVCLRTNSAAMVIGSIADAGNRYEIELSALPCGSRPGLATVKATATSRNEVIKELGIAALGLRRQLGEPQLTLQQFNQPLEIAMTPSPEALKAFAMGNKEQQQGSNARGVEYLKRAVEMDPSFTVAYAKLGSFEGDLFENAAANEDTARAFDSRDRVTGRWRFYIEMLYYRSVVGDVEKSLQISQEMSHTYPNDWTSHSHLSVALRSVGLYERAANEAREAIRLNPNGYVPYYNLMYSEIAMNRLNEAKAVFEEAQSHRIDSAGMRVLRYWVAFLENDGAAMQEQVNLEAASSEPTGSLFNEQSGSEYYFGRFGHARQLLAQAVAVSSRAGFTETAAEYKAEQAVTEAEVGNLRQARRYASEVPTLRPGTEIKAEVALALARVGDPAARDLAVQLSRDMANNKQFRDYPLACVQAAIALHRGEPVGAAQLLEPARLYELGGPPPGPLYHVYLRGLAYLEAHKGKEAAAEFQKIIDHPAIVVNNIWGALAHLQLARAQVMMGDKEAARKSYQGFLTLWKDADPDIPIYKQAKAEYAKLK
jgi:serine/threonine protein kinase/tetratricopeptide (TPR) repeat protein